MAQICTKSFVGWGFAPDTTGELTAPLHQTPSWFRGWAPGEREGGVEGKRRGGREGVLECPNPELASLAYCNVDEAFAYLCARTPVMIVT